MGRARDKVSVGVDVELVERFGIFEQRRSHRFLQHAFFASELTSCFARAAPAQHLAARWAAKEAVIKAVSHAGYRQIRWRNVEIVERGGAPRVRWHGVGRGWEVAVSLSHSGGLALAVAMVRQLV